MERPLARAEQAGGESLQESRSWGTGPQPGYLHPTQTQGRFSPSYFALSSAVGAGRGRLGCCSLGLWAKAIYPQGEGE